MPNSTQNQADTLQNQSNAAALHRYYGTIDFSDGPISPIGYLWTHIPDTVTDWVHVHDHLEFGRCISGSGTFNINGSIHRIQAPCCSVIYGGVWHSAQSNPYDKCVWNFISIDLKKLLPEIGGKQIKAIKGMEWQKYEFPALMSKHEYPQIHCLIDEIFEESASIRENSYETLTTLITALLLRHSRLMTPTSRVPNDPHTVERIAPALSYISGHYAENITVKQLADMCFISEATLRRYFYAFSNMSPQDYLQHTRIKSAAVMLITTQKSVLDIACDTGFPTSSCFNRQFAKLYKMSPRSYRIAHRK